MAAPLKNILNEGSLQEYIYEKTGVGQRTLAKLIGANQSTFSLYESGEHLLPTANMQQLTNMYGTVQNLPAPVFPQPSLIEQQQLMEQAAWCRTQCIPLQKELQAIQSRQMQCLQLLQLLDTEWVNSRNTSSSSQRSIAEYRFQAEKKLEKNGWLPQQQLKIKIAALLHEAECCEAACPNL